MVLEAGGDACDFGLPYSGDGVCARCVRHPQCRLLASALGPLNPNHVCHLCWVWSKVELQRSKANQQAECGRGPSTTAQSATKRLLMSPRSSCPCLLHRTGARSAICCRLRRRKSRLTLLAARSLWLLNAGAVLRLETGRFEPVKYCTFECRTAKEKDA